MLITLFILPLIHTQKITEKHLSLSLYQEHVIDTLNETGYTYYYNLEPLQSHFTESKYCLIHPQKLTIQKLEQLKITHQNEIEFENNFINGTYYGKTVFINQAVINNYGIIILLSNCNLKFIYHKNHEHIDIQLNFTHSLDDAILLQNEKLNSLMILLANNIVYEYNFDIASSTNCTINFQKTYTQDQLLIQQILKIEPFDSYFVVLNQYGELTIIIKNFQTIYQFEDKAIYFEVESTFKNNKITILYQNFTIYQYFVEFDENTVILSQTTFKIESRISQAQKFKLYEQGILVVVYDQGSIVIDYAFQNNTLNKINTQYVENKVNHILIHDTYAILISDRSQKEIPIGINQIFLNQQNFQIPQTLLVPNIINTLFYNSVMDNQQTKQVYVYTDFQMIKLKLKIELIKIVCSCHNVTEAEQPINLKFTYYNTQCNDCEQQKYYKVAFKYTLITSEQRPFIYLFILLGFILFLAIITASYYKYAQFRNYMNEARNQKMYLEMQPTYPMEESINDSKVQFAIENENTIKQQN